jgi:exosortase F-associated protein
MSASKRYILTGLAIGSLITLYLLQRTNYAEIFYAIFNAETPSPNAQFIINRTLRYIFNDLSVILLLYALFQNKTLIKVAFGLQIFGLFIILPLYFYFKLTLEGPSEISSPLLSFIHRIVVNPILMLLLIPAFYYQKHMNRPKAK